MIRVELFAGGTEVRCSHAMISYGQLALFDPQFEAKDYEMLPPNTIDFISREGRDSYFVMKILVSDNFIYFK